MAERFGIMNLLEVVNKGVFMKNKTYVPVQGLDEMLIRKVSDRFKNIPFKEYYPHHRPFSDYDFIRGVQEGVKELLNKQTHIDEINKLLADDNVDIFVDYLSGGQTFKINPFYKKDPWLLTDTLFLKKDETSNREFKIGKHFGTWFVKIVGAIEMEKTRKNTSSNTKRKPPINPPSPAMFLGNVATI